MPGHLESIAKLAIVGAIIDTLEKDQEDYFKPQINRNLVRMQIEVENAIDLWQKLTDKEVVRVANKIDKVKKVTCLSKPRSSITFIEFSIALLETILDKVRVNKYCLIMLLINLLQELRFEIAGNREYFLSSKAAVHAVEQWESIVV